MIQVDLVFIGSCPLRKNKYIYTIGPSLMNMIIASSKLLLMEGLVPSQEYSLLYKHYSYHLKNRLNFGEK